MTIQSWLGLKWTPEQISRSLRLHFPDQPEMHVSHETIYQALYVQGRGELSPRPCEPVVPSVSPNVVLTSLFTLPGTDGDDQRPAVRGRRPGRSQPLGG